MRSRRLVVAPLTGRRPPAAGKRIAVGAVRVALRVDHRLVDGGDDASVPVGDGQAVAIAVGQHRWIVVRSDAKLPGVFPRGTATNQASRPPMNPSEYVRNTGLVAAFSYDGAADVVAANLHRDAVGGRVGQRRVGGHLRPRGAGSPRAGQAARRARPHTGRAGGATSLRVVEDVPTEVELRRALRIDEPQVEAVAARLLHGDAGTDGRPSVRPHEESADVAVVERAPDKANCPCSQP